MKKQNENAFGIITCIMLSIINIGNLIWTIALGIEQVQTGWGYGTHFELAILIPWMVQILCLPGILLGIVYVLFAYFRTYRRPMRIVNLVLLLVILLQYGLVHLFIFY